MSQGDPAYAQFPYTPKNQHLHQHQYTQQQNQYAPIAQTTSGAQNAQYVNTSIAHTLRRYKTSITPPTPRQFPSTQHPSIAPPLTTENSPSPSQCLSTNNVTSISTSISSSLPASLPTPPSVPAGLSSPNSGTVAATFELQDIIAQFENQPELLKLILTSKVEEDKRKAEEAKLRVRELDLMLYERDKQRRIIDHVDESKNEEIQDMGYENASSIGTFPTSDGTLNYASFGTSLSSPVQNLSLNSPSSTPISQSTPRLKPASRLPKATQNDQNAIETAEHNECNTNGTPNKRKRKRREMLPVTMIIETKEHPYLDDYLWKNNGNTTQRKTGNKSVYFKCSNSNKGCPVNKTVTEKEGGWIIKYRGHHLDECGKVKRIIQS